MTTANLSGIKWTSIASRFCIAEYEPQPESSMYVGANFPRFIPLFTVSR